VPALPDNGVKVRHLGHTDLEVTEICLGTMPFGHHVDEPTAFAIMDAAYAAGVRFFDTADVYPPPATTDVRGRSEQIVGTWLKRRKLRSRVVLATKVGKPVGAGRAALSRTAILRACDNSLRRLQTSWIDVYLAHVPDWETPVDETLSAFHELVQSGKVRSIGCSHFPAEQVLQWLHTTQSMGMSSFGATQERYNLLERELERLTLPLCAVYGVGIVAHSPLAGGLLTDRYAATRPAAEPAARLGKLAARHGHRLTHVALSWVLAQPAITSAIVGASHPDQLRDSLGGLGLNLDAQLIYAIEETLGRDRGH
jgi:aryl-alcohol dehydrogenase (NADP+)